MKRTIYFLAVVILSCNSRPAAQTQPPQPPVPVPGAAQPVKHHNKIDDIKTPREISSLLKSIDKSFSDFNIPARMNYKDKICQRLADSLKAPTFVKADFDHNGYTDLLVTGQGDGPVSVFILDSGDKYSVIKWSQNAERCCEIVTVADSGNEVIVSLNTRYQSWAGKKGIELKKLEFRWGEFIEYNPAPKNYHIEKIEFTTTMCYGSCPEFKLTIGNDRNARFEAIKYNDREGTYTGTIDAGRYDELTSLLNYIAFPDLADDYKVDFTDQQTCNLTITYSGGKTKTITDYGLMGTFGLHRAYRMLFQLRKGVNWK